MTDCRVIRVYDPGFAEIVSDYFLNTALADRVRNAATASPRLRQNWSNSRSSCRIFNVEFSGLIPRRLCNTHNRLGDKRSVVVAPFYWFS
jgi:hypothetical protein